MGRENKGAHGADIVNGFTKYLSGRASLDSSVGSMLAYWLVPAEPGHLVKAVLWRLLRTITTYLQLERRGMQEVATAGDWTAATGSLRGTIQIASFLA